MYPSALRTVWRPAKGRRGGTGRPCLAAGTVVWEHRRPFAALSAQQQQQQQRCGVGTRLRGPMRGMVCPCVRARACVPVVCLALTALCGDRLLCRQLGRAFREASKAHETAQLLEPMRSVLSVARNLRDERMMELAEQFLLQATSGS